MTPQYRRVAGEQRHGQLPSPCRPSDRRPRAIDQFAQHRSGPSSASVPPRPRRTAQRSGAGYGGGGAYRWQVGIQSFRGGRQTDFVCRCRSAGFDNCPPGGKTYRRTGDTTPSRCGLPALSNHPSIAGSFTVTSGTGPPTEPGRKLKRVATSGNLRPHSTSKVGACVSRDSPPVPPAIGAADAVLLDGNSAGVSGVFYAPPAENFTSAAG